MVFEPSLQYLVCVEFVLFVNGQPFLILTVAGIEIARLEISLQVALALRVLGIPICD
ncbi:DUF3956 domain-containing protein [Bacillus toyonensis]|uniref:DUF3956 domain-containing protein n=2 Tax=Bacillus cereus group TaxID=86661 RepID=A0AB36SFS0_9BACI|nr:DUF3956 family protein [Bacillus sp. EKM202B]KXY06411.1 hypothetical protein AT260_20470 [Bacillus wiedmannii]MBJ8040031.1 DUF3956 family protein [Bacillus cereus group sp. N17]PDY50491.1 DUF3956 domain-containing protein [Bacillus toyonensis]PDZ82404.1 DUF3956 domain-containing protein [Bacillus toyonensis]